MLLGCNQVCWLCVLSTQHTPLCKRIKTNKLRVWIGTLGERTLSWGNSARCEEKVLCKWGYASASVCSVAFFIRV